MLVKTASMPRGARHVHQSPGVVVCARGGGVHVDCECACVARSATTPAQAASVAEANEAAFAEQRSTGRAAELKSVKKTDASRLVGIEKYFVTTGVGACIIF